VRCLALAVLRQYVAVALTLVALLTSPPTFIAPPVTDQRLGTNRPTIALCSTAHAPTEAPALRPEASAAAIKGSAVLRRSSFA